MDLLMITDEMKSHYAYFNGFNRLMCNKTKNKNEMHFFKYCLQCFSSEEVFVEHTGTCLKINGKETVKFKSDWIKFKIHFKQLAASFKIYADFECHVKRVSGSNRKKILRTLKNIKNALVAVLPTKVAVLMINLLNQLKKCNQ